MFKQFKAHVCAALIILCMAGSAMAGFVILQVEVVPGFAIDVPESLLLPKAAPGQISEGTLDVKVWANAPWILMAKMGNEGPAGIFEHRSIGASWVELGSAETTVFESENATGVEGREFSIPFRFRADYDDAPGEYSVEIELTVVPRI